MKIKASQTKIKKLSNINLLHCAEKQSLNLFPRIMWIQSLRKARKLANSNDVSYVIFTFRVKD